MDNIREAYRWRDRFVLVFLSFAYRLLGVKAVHHYTGTEARNLAIRSDLHASTLTIPIDSSGSQAAFQGWTTLVYHVPLR